MEISELLSITEQIAPELRDRLKLTLREADWPMPPNVYAAATWSPPPWAEASGALIVFEPVAVTLETLLHELSHIVPAPPAPVSPRPVLAEADFQRAWTAPLTRNDLPRWHDHDDKFVRRLIHLGYRAEQHGHTVNLEEALPSERYALRSMLDYRDALGDEPAQCSGMTFAEIEETPPPEQFTRLFREDRHIEAVATIRRQLEDEAHGLRVEMFKIEHRIAQLNADNREQTQPILHEMLSGSWSPERFDELTKRNAEINAVFYAATDAAASEYRRLESYLSKIEAKITIFTPPCPAPPVRADA